MTRDIAKTRERCSTCNGIAPSQAAMPPTTPATPGYPFQHVCGDLFHHMGNTYLVLVDRYSHWPIVTVSRDGAKGLVNTLRDTFEGVHSQIAIRASVAGYQTFHTLHPDLCSAVGMWVIL